MEEGDSDYEYCLEVIDYNLRDDNISLIRTDYQVEVISDKNSGNKECQVLDIYQTEGNKEKRVEPSVNESGEFSCSECQFKTKSRSVLERHAARVHPAPLNSDSASIKTNRIQVRTKSQINNLAEKNDKGNKKNASGKKVPTNYQLPKGRKQNRSASRENICDLKSKGKPPRGNENILKIKSGKSGLKKNRLFKNKQVKKKQTDSDKVYSPELVKSSDSDTKEQFTNKLYSLKPVLNDEEALMFFSFDNYLFKNTFVCTECGFFDSDKSRFNLHWLRTHMKVFDSFEADNEVEIRNRASEKYFDSLQLSINSPKVERSKDKQSYNVLCCNLCNFFSGETAKFVLHLRQHVEQRVFACGHCDGKFLLQDSLKEHVILCHEKDPLYCPVCYHTGDSKTDLKSHLAIHLNTTP